MVNRSRSGLVKMQAKIAIILLFLPSMPNENVIQSNSHMNYTIWIFLPESLFCVFIPLLIEKPLVSWGYSLWGIQSMSLQGNSLKLFAPTVPLNRQPREKLMLVFYDKTFSQRSSVRGYLFTIKPVLLHRTRSRTRYAIRLSRVCITDFWF